MHRIAPRRRLLLLSGALALPIPRLARAQDLVVRSNALTAQANSGTVGVIAGGVDGTYIRIAADLAAVLDDGVRLRVIPIIGKGSLQNLSDIMFLRGIDIGIVQSDVLAFAQRQRLFPALEQRCTTSRNCTTRRSICWPVATFAASRTWPTGRSMRTCAAAERR